MKKLDKWLIYSKRNVKMFATVILSIYTKNEQVKQVLLSETKIKN